MDAAEIRRRLADPFPASVVGWKAQTVKNNRALAVAYIDARDVMDRLDDVFGVGGWQDTYSPMGDGVLCALAVRIDGEWVEKQDVGSPSEQPDAGDRAKAAVSDALKRAAVKFGVGRYLYSLPTLWADYDPTKKQLAAPPQLPAWAMPGGSGRPNTPAPGVNAHRATNPPPDAPPPFVVLRNLLQNSQAEPALKSAYGAAYKAHERGEVTDEEFGKLTALKDAMKAKLATPAA